MTVTPTVEAVTSSSDALDALFKPESVVLVGASGDNTKHSGLPLANLQDCGFDGRIHAVNRRGVEIDGVQTHRAISDIDDKVDAAILMVPAKHCPDALRELGQLGTRAAVVAVSGFAELGTDEGRRLQDELVEVAHANGIRLVGPNCNGIYETRRPLSLGYNHLHALKLPPGGIALLSHSGAIGGTAYELIEPFGASLSHFVSCGNEADLQLLDYADYLVENPDVKVFALLLDAVEDGPRFRRFARRARELGKPILVMKLGNSDLAREATVAHSSRLSGSADVYNAVFHDDGVVMVPTLETLMITAGLASVGRSSDRPGIVVSSPSGGGAISLTDTLNRQGVELASLDVDTVASMGDTSGFATIMNPFDLGAGTSQNAHANVLALAGADGVGSIAFVVTILQTEAGMLRYANAFVEAQKQYPDLAVVVAALAPLRNVEDELYRSVGIPVVRSTSETANILEALQKLALAKLRSPGVDPSTGAGSRPDLPAVEALERGITPSEAEAKELLAAYGVTHPAERLVSFDQADLATDELSYPVVVKGCARNLAHKTEHGLVEVGVADAEVFREVAAKMRATIGQLPSTDGGALLVAEMVTGGAEVIVGLVRDAEFGLVAVVGPGGTAVELIGELHHLALPISEERLDDVLGRGVLGRLLDEHRGALAADRTALKELIVGLAAAAQDLDELVEAVELNPVMVGRGPGAGAVALDALITPRELDR